MTKERLLRAVGHDLRDTNFLSATEPERIGAPDTHLLVARANEAPLNDCLNISRARVVRALTFAPLGQADRNSYVIGAGACEMLSPVWAAASRSRRRVWIGPDRPSIWQSRLAQPDQVCSFE